MVVSWNGGRQHSQSFFFDREALGLGTWVKLKKHPNLGIPKRKPALMFWIYDWAERRACSLHHGSYLKCTTGYQVEMIRVYKAMICLVDWKSKTIQWWTEGYPMKWGVGANPSHWLIFSKMVKTTNQTTCWSFSWGIMKILHDNDLLWLDQQNRHCTTD